MDNHSFSDHIPVITIFADLPLGRIIPNEFGSRDHTLVPWTFALFQELESQKSFQIHWVTLKRYAKHYAVHHVNGQIIHVLPAPSIALGLLTGHFLATWKIKRLLSALKPDLIHVWGIEMPYAKACSSLKNQKILSYQGVLTAYCQRGRMNIFPHLQAFWERRTTPRYNHITCESPWARDRILEIAPHAQVKLIEYGVEESFCHIKRTPAPTPECLFVGTLYELKGIRYLVEAFTHPSLQHIHLYIVGKGNLQRELELKSTPNIHWEGALERPALQKRMSSTWCLVHPTLADSSPNCVKEARMIGIPVITTKEGGQTQYVVHEKSGYIVPIKNSEAIRKAVLSITESLAHSLSMGMHNLDEIRKSLDIKLTSKNFLCLYQSFLNSKIRNIQDET